MFHQRQFNCNQSDLSDTSSLAKVWTYVYSITTVSNFLFFRCFLSVLTACNRHRRHINDLCFQLMSIKYPSRRGNINGATYFTMSLKQTKNFLEGMGRSKNFLLPWPPHFVTWDAVDLFWVRRSFYWCWVVSRIRFALAGIPCSF